MDKCNLIQLLSLKYTRENRVEVQVSCRSLIQKERILSEHCQISDFFEVRAARRKSCWTIIRDYFLRNKRIIFCLKPDPSWICKDWRSKMQTELSKRQVYSFTLKGWNSTRPITHLIIPRERRIGYAPKWTKRERVLGEDRMRNLWERFLFWSVLYSSWNSETLEDRWTFLFKRKKVSPQWISLKFRSYKIKWPPWSSDVKQFWFIRRSRSSYEYSESSWTAQPRFLLAAWHTELIWYIGKRFWRSTCTKWRKFKKFCCSFLRARVSEHRDSASAANRPGNH